MATIPADATMLAPAMRTLGNVISIEATAMTVMTTTVMRRSRVTCVCTRRACRLSATSIR